MSRPRPATGALTGPSPLDSDRKATYALSAIRDREVVDLRNQIAALGNEVQFADKTSELSGLVSATDLRDRPIHRWYYYKEGFSPDLPSYLIEHLGTGATQTVVDAFAGVGTTALSLQSHPAVRRAIGIEYSPFAQFVGETKLKSWALDPAVLHGHASRIFALTPRAQLLEPPDLAAFRNPEIFSQATLQDILIVLDAIRNDQQLGELERNFLLIGVAAVIEDLSGAMKDGRALRILRGRRRRRQGLSPQQGSLPGSNPREVIWNQWTAMIEDLKVESCRPTASTRHLLGDARSLARLCDSDGQQILGSESVGIHVYSPPYLNCIDYTEVYKLELWLLGYVSDQAQFRKLREGTLRSHPSINFPARQIDSRPAAEVFRVIDAVTEFLASNLSRPPIGAIHGQYFTDMFEVLRDQYETLEPGGSFACVVANSMFSRRSKGSDGRLKEIWRLPVMTDVLIARIAEAVGFEQLEIWVARQLRPKNVSDASARESVVVGRRPGSIGLLPPPS